MEKIGETKLLQGIYKKVYTTPQVAAEFKNQLPDWIIIQAIKGDERFKQLETELDSGEASAIALSYEIEDVIVVLDDWSARRTAERLKIHFTGTFGIMVKAKQTGVITSVKPLLNKVRQTNFHFSEEVFRQTLNEAGEQ
ncbi:MAG TPA: DUF3368 domain-containing protein [Chitinophagales bacterium]|nr:DUF3368 domain-containing protein [Chitinophagales bacterium]